MRRVRNRHPVQGLATAPRPCAFMVLCHCADDLVQVARAAGAGGRALPACQGRRGRALCDLTLRTHNDRACSEWQRACSRLHTRPQYQRSLEQFETDLLLEAVCDCIVKKKQGLSLGKF